MDYDDVAQIIRIHIHKKWDHYEASRPLGPWLNTIITNQIRNLVRNHYSNFSRPCTRCAAAVGETGCSIYKTQCSDCPLFAYWQKKKQSATFIKLPVSIENHQKAVASLHDESMDIEKNIEKVHEKMKEILKPIEWRVYQGLFIECKEEAEVAADLGYISNEPGRDPGYKQIKNIRKIIITKAKLCLLNGEVDIF